MCSISFCDAHRLAEISRHRGHLQDIAVRGCIADRESPFDRCQNFPTESGNANGIAAIGMLRKFDIEDVAGTGRGPAGKGLHVVTCYSVRPDQGASAYVVKVIAAESRAITTAKVSGIRSFGYHGGA